MTVNLLFWACPQDWQLLGAGTELTTPCCHRWKVTLKQTAALGYNTPNSPGAWQQHTPTVFKSIYNPIKTRSPRPSTASVSLHTTRLLSWTVNKTLFSSSLLCEFSHSPCHQPPTVATFTLLGLCCKLSEIIHVQCLTDTPMNIHSSLCPFCLPCVPSFQVLIAIFDCLPEANLPPLPALWLWQSQNLFQLGIQLKRGQTM